MQIVNGYSCQNCTDVALARKGVDPAHPDQDPSNPNYAGKSDRPGQSAQSGFSSSSVSFGGALATANASSPVLSSVLGAYTPGSLTDLTA